MNNITLGRVTTNWGALMWRLHLTRRQAHINTKRTPFRPAAWLALGAALVMAGCAPSVSKDRCGASEFCPPAAHRGDFWTAVPIALEDARKFQIPADEVISVLQASGYDVIEISAPNLENAGHDLRRYRIEAHRRPRSLTKGALFNKVVTSFTVSKTHNHICQAGSPETIVDGSNIIKPNLEEIYADCRN